MTDKIRISLDDVNSSDVDLRLKQQSAVARTTEHYRQQVAPSMPSMTGNRGGTSIWFNTVFYMTFFGLIGGLLAWPLSEFAHQVLNRSGNQWLQYLSEYTEIENQVRDGGISQSAAVSEVDSLNARYRGNPLVDTLNDSSLSESEKTTRMESFGESLRSAAFFSTLILCTVSGMCIAVLLSIADATVAKNVREAIINGSVALCLGMLGGILVGSFIDILYQALGGGTGEGGLFWQIVARALGWAILGLFLAAAPGLMMRSPKKLVIGLLGGFLGGLIGGGLFDPVSMLTGTAWISRFMSLAAIGAIAGFGTGLIENAAKTGWMKVVGGLIAGKQFILYKNQTTIGSSPQCEIYLFKDPQVAPQHAEIRQVPQGFDIQDLGTTSGTFVNGAAISRARLKNNDQIQIGSTVFSFQEKAKAQS